MQIENPPGLKYFPNYISESEERKLLTTIDALPWKTDLKRRVQHYGYTYDYRIREVNPAMKLGDIPDWLIGLCERLSREGLFERMPDQVIVNEYMPGQGIALHIDRPTSFGDTIASLSLAAPIIMDFQEKDADVKTCMTLEPRSLFVLTGAARYHWQHGITARKSDPYQDTRIPDKDASQLRLELSWAKRWIRHV